MAPEPEKVRSGNFRVDRKEALRKLAAYRLADPTAFILCWIRAAVASRATWIKVTIRETFVEVRFDGPDWTAAELEDPYSAFFESEGEPGSRARQFVAGSLSAFQLKALEVTVLSGEGGERRLLRLLPESALAESAVGAGDDTVLKARWETGSLEADHRMRLWSHVKRRCGMLRPRLEASWPLGEHVVLPLSAEAEAPTLQFEADGVRGILRVPAKPRAVTGEASLYTRGVQVTSVEWTFHPIQVEAHLDDPAFALDASQSHVVMDDRFRRALQSADERVSDLLELALKQHAESYPRLTRFLFEGDWLGGLISLAGWDFSGELGWTKNRRVGFSGILPWAGWDGESPLGDLFCLLAGRAGERERLLAWDGRTGSWLRAAAARLPAEEPADPVLRKLFHAPLYLSVTGALMSVADLDRLVKLLGVLPVSRRLFPGESLDPPVVWCPWAGDPVIEERFRLRVVWRDEIENLREGPTSRFQ